MLTIHHLGISQSERIVWLCEELEIDYDLKRYDRDPRSRLAPKDYKALHPIGAAPVIQDGALTLAESAAVIDYIMATYGGGRLAARPGDPNFADYLYWFHFANGTLQPALMRSMGLKRAGVAADHPVLQMAERRRALALDFVETRVGEAPYLAGAHFSAADIMILFSLTTMRHFMPYDLTGYPHIRQYIARLAARPAYVLAMAKGDPRMELLLT